MNPAIWIPMVITAVSFSAYFSYRSNQEHTPLFIFLNWVCWSMPTWTVVTVYSKNIIFDGVIYDIIAIITFAIVTAFLMSKGGFHFTIGQGIGIIVMILGIGIFKISSI